MSTDYRAGRPWTPEEADELIDLVLEQGLTLLYDPKLAWFRVSVQLDKPPWECKCKWMDMRARIEEEPCPCPFYQDVDGESEVVLWYTKQDSYVEPTRSFPRC